MPTIYSLLSTDQLTPLEHKRLDKLVLQLSEGTTKSAGQDQKEQGLFTGRLNQKDRVFFTYTAESNIVLLHITPHDYDKDLPIAIKRLGNAREDNSTFPIYAFHPSNTPQKSNSEAIHNESINWDFDITPKHYFRNNVINFSPTQEHLIYLKNSFIAYGLAGTGKSSSMLFLIEQLLNANPEKPILVLLRTQALVCKTQEDWSSLLLLNNLNPNLLKITTIEKYIKEIHPQIKISPTPLDSFIEFYSTLKKDKTTRATFNTIESACKNPPPNKKMPDKDKDSFFAQNLYHELCLIAAWSGYESDNQTVTQKQSYFKINAMPQAKTAILKILSDYRKHLEKNKLLDLTLSNFSGLSTECPQFSHVIFDEGQNVELNIFKTLGQQGDECVVFMDDNQSTASPKSSILLRQQLLTAIKPTAISAPIRLIQSYRCATAVERIGYGILKMRDILSGISWVAFKADPNKEQGEASLIRLKSSMNVESITAIHQKIACYEKTEVLIITPEDKAEVQALFPGYIICHPKEVPGLEYQCAVLYQPLGKNSGSLYWEANKKLNVPQNNPNQKSSVPDNIKHGTDLKDWTFMSLFNEFYMTVTRASHEVIILQQEVINGNNIILDALQESFPILNNEVAKPAHSFSKHTASTVENTQEKFLTRIYELLAADTPDIAYIHTLVEDNLYTDTRKAQRWIEFINHLKAKGKFSQYIPEIQQAIMSLAQPVEKIIPKATPKSIKNDVIITKPPLSSLSLFVNQALFKMTQEPPFSFTEEEITRLSESNVLEAFEKADLFALCLKDPALAQNIIKRQTSKKMLPFFATFIMHFNSPDTAKTENIFLVTLSIIQKLVEFNLGTNLMYHQAMNIFRDTATKKIDHVKKVFDLLNEIHQKHLKHLIKPHKSKAVSNVDHSELHLHRDIYITFINFCSATHLPGTSEEAIKAYDLLQTDIEKSYLVKLHTNSIPLTNAEAYRSIGQVFTNEISVGTHDISTVDTIDKLYIFLQKYPLDSSWHPEQIENIFFVFATLFYNIIKYLNPHGDLLHPIENFNTTKERYSSFNVNNRWIKFISLLRNEIFDNCLINWARAPHQNTRENLSRNLAIMLKNIKEKKIPKSAISNSAEICGYLNYINTKYSVPVTLNSVFGGYQGLFLSTSNPTPSAKSSNEALDKVDTKEKNQNMPIEEELSARSEDNDGLAYSRFSCTIM